MLVGERDVADAHHPAHLRRGPAAGLAGHRPPRLGPVGERPPHAALLVRARRGHGRQHARPLHRLRVPAPGQHQRLQLGPRELGQDAFDREPQHPVPELQPLPQRHRAGRSGPAPAHLPLDPGRRVLPRSPGHEPGPLPALGQPGPRARRPQPEVRRRLPARRHQLRPRASSRPAASRWWRTSPTSTTTATAGSTTTTCCSRSPCAAASPTRNLLLDDCDNTYFAFYAQDDWRRDSAADAQPGPALGDGHRRQEHQRLSGHEPAS